MIYNSFLKELFFQISDDKGGIYPETFGYLINELYLSKFVRLRFQNIYLLKTKSGLKLVNI